MGSEMCIRDRAPLVRTLGRIRLLRWIALGLVNFSDRLLPRRLRTGAPSVSEEELLAVADRALASASIDAEEHELIESVIAFGDTLVDVAPDTLPGIRCDHRSHFRIGLTVGPDLERLDPRRQLFKHSVGRIVPDSNNHRYRHTAFARRTVGSTHHSIDHLPHIGIGHHDHVILGSA